MHVIMLHVSSHQIRGVDDHDLWHLTSVRGDQDQTKHRMYLRSGDGQEKFFYYFKTVGEECQFRLGVMDEFVKEHNIVHLYGYY